MNAYLGMILKTEWACRTFCGKNISNLMIALGEAFSVQTEK